MEVEDRDAMLVARARPERPIIGDNVKFRKIFISMLIVDAFIGVFVS